MFSSISESVLGFLEAVLTFLHDIVEPVFGVHSWGWAIILLTLIVRVLLLPIAIKQTRSMRAMQAIQPKMKEIQNRHKVDRELMRKDPERYKAKKQKMNEEMMALYQEEGVNPAASCLPLLAQAPVFIALFWAIRGLDALQNAPFYFFTDYIAVGEDGFSGLGALVSTAGWPGWLLIVVMSGTMFVTQKQMMARTAATNGDNPMAQQQKILLYVMPLFLAVVSFQFMLGLLLYWVTTNIWQIVQQWVILRDVRSESTSAAPPAKKPGAGGTGGATSGKKPSADGPPANKRPEAKPEKGKPSDSKPAPKPPSKGAKPVNGSSGSTPTDDADAAGTGPKGRARGKDRPSGDGAGGSTGNARPVPKGGRAGGRPPGGGHLPKRGRNDDRS